MTWKLYYPDGTTFDSTQGEPWEAPAYPVIAILQGAVVEHGRDWYLWRKDYQAWIGVKGDASLALQMMKHARFIEACVAGENLPNEVFQAVLDRAVNDQSRNRTG